MTKISHQPEKTWGTENMYYSAIGLLAAAILLIENHDILLYQRGAFEKNAWRIYRRFLFAVLAYYVTDILWGFLESRKLSVLLFADTTVYFIALAAGVLFWAQFTVAYLEEQTLFGRFLISAGRVVAGLITLLSVVNIFEPVLFTVDAGGVYRALPGRYAALACQILLLLLISACAVSNLRLRRAEMEKRCLALVLFGLIMALFLFVQLWFPNWPLYSIAYMLGTCLLHTYVVNDEKEEYRRGLAEAGKVRELRDTMASMLDNLPAMVFAKDAQSGVYLACNQTFADYAGKEKPEDAVGLTDAQLFGPETAKHFMHEDQVALSMDEPYIFFEDVEGREYQTTKRKYLDHAGQLCVLGVCQDVTDMVRIRRDDALTKEDYEKAHSTGVIYNHIAQALAGGYMVFYYVNLDSEEFIKYRNDDDSGRMTEEKRGYHFFEACRLEVGRIVHPDDRAAVVSALRRKTLVAALDRNKTFVMNFRYLTQSGEKYVTLRVSRMEDDEHYIILGLTDVDELMKHRRAIEQVREEQLAYSRLKALNGNYIWVYVVVPETGAYRELSEVDEAGSPTMAKEGEDFFAAVREASRKYTCTEDQERFLAAFTRENVLAEIESKGVFTLHYRFLLDGVRTYVILKAAKVEEKDGARLVVGLINVDDQRRLEEKNEKRYIQAQARASVDALTGIKNKHAYLEAEERLNEQIAQERAPEFAVTLLDVNDLKRVNDTEGHSAGDQLIRDACKIVCDTFKRSPVFRIGGDEFAVLSRGDDYEHIEELVAKIGAHNENALQNGGIVIACGMARYDNDESVAPVFERADQKMYENKSKLKMMKTAGRSGLQ